MKKTIILTLLIVTTIRLSMAQCSENVLKRVLLVGDSWASFMNIDATFENVFKKWGHSNYTYTSNATIAFNGAVSDDFLDSSRLAAIRNELLQNPEIDIVHLSIGGNDVLGDWNVSFSPAQTDSLMYLVYNKVSSIIDSIKLMKPGLRIVWSGYVFPNFGEIINDLGALQSIHPFYGLWTGMGSPTFIQLNTILNSYSAMMDTLAQTDPQVEFVRCNGLMQYLFGQNTTMSVPPTSTYAPFTAPIDDGFPSFPSPKSSMRNYGVFRDCFHLSPASYDEFIRYQTRKFYHKFLMDDQYLPSEGGTRDGSVSSSGIVTNTLQMGSVNGEDVSLVLSFNTTLLPDTGIGTASIFIRREYISGNNPVQAGSLLLRIASGRFGNLEDVEGSDFASVGNASSTPCFFGSYQNDGDWIRIEVPSAMLPYITNDSITQFIISSYNASGSISFTNAIDPELAPILNLGFTANATATQEVVSSAIIDVFPNPTDGLLFINSYGKNVTKITLFDTAGKILLQNGPMDVLDLTNYKHGIYILMITTQDSQTIKKIIHH